jgi:predicted nucleic acid-binding protein
MKRTLLDTNVYIDWLNDGMHEELVLGPGRVRILSAVVLMELRAGARTRRAVRGVDQLARAYQSARRVAAPSSNAYDDAGDVLRELRHRGRDVRRSSLVNDVLIALTARAQGASVVTRDGSDFAAIRQISEFSLEIVA